MINMSYCRFEKTEIALEQCINALYENGFESLSESEKECAARLYDLAKDYINKYEVENEIL